MCLICIVLMLRIRWCGYWFVHSFRQTQWSHTFSCGSLSPSPFSITQSPPVLFVDVDYNEEDSRCINIRLHILEPYRRCLNFLQQIHIILLLKVRQHTTCGIQRGIHTVRRNYSERGGRDTECDSQLCGSSGHS